MIYSVWPYIIIVAFILADKLLKKKFPAIWWKLQLPWLVVMTLLSTVMIGILLSAMAQALTEPASDGDKWVIGILLGALIVVFIANSISAWKDWLRERAKRKS